MQNSEVNAASADRTAPAKVIPVTSGEDEPLSLEDLRLIHALQVVPRASWTALGKVLDCDPVTAARRWERLVDGGIAWVTAYRLRRQGSLALVDLRCAPGSALAVAARLATDREAVTIDVTVGGRDLVVTVWGDSQDRLGEYLLTRFADVDGVVDSRTHLITEVVDDARSWRLRVLGESELAALEAIPRATNRRARASVEPDVADAVMAELARDGRVRAVDLARTLDTTPDRARAILNAVLASEGMVVRTEIARRYSGRPNYAWFHLRVPARAVPDVLRRLSGLHDLRLLATAVGTCNIVMAMWLAGLDDVQRVEALIEQVLPTVDVADRSLVLRTTKHLGRPLTPAGLSAV